MRRTFFFFAVVLLIATAAFAQTSTTAALRGKVTNDAGTPVANAEINAVNAASGFVKTVRSGPDGAYVLAGLTPGTYNIVVAATGFEPKSQDITVLVGQSLQLDLRVSTQAVLKESITVVGNQAVETRTSEVATNVTTQQIENLPQDDRNFLNFAALAPGIRLSTDPQRKTFAGDAQDPEQTNIFIDGVSTKNDVLLGGSVGQDSSRGNPFPQSAVQEFRVITQNYSAQYDHASSAIISAVTKSGTNEFKGEAFGFYQPKAWVAPTKKDFKYSTLTTNSSYHRIQPGISFGGPIIKDHLQFFATYEGDDEQASHAVAITTPGGTPAYASQFSSFIGSFSSPFKSTLAFGKLSWQAAANQTLDFSGNYRREHETRDFGGTTSFESATDYRNWVYGATLRDQLIIGNALNEATASLQTFGWNPTPLNADLVGKLYFTPNFTTIIRTGGNSTLQKFDQRRLELRDNFNFAPMEMHGTHSFQIGGNVDFMHYNVDKSLNGIPLYKYMDDPGSGRTFAQPFEVDYGIGNPILKISNNEYGIYGQDSWAVNPKLTLNLGLRWDYESHMLDENFVTPANIVAALKGKTFQFNGRSISIPDEYFSTGSERKPYKDEFQPRLGFSYDLQGNGKSVVFGGWGKYYDRLFLNSTLDERFRQQFPVYRFEFSAEGPTVHPGTIKWQDSYLTPAGLQGLIAQGDTHPEIYLLSNNTKPPYSTQYNVGFRQAFGDWLGSASYNAVRAKRGITYVAASGTCCGSFAPGYNAVILNDPVGKSFWYDGESITLDRPFTSQTRWGARFTYTHAKSEQNGNDLFSLDLPSAADYARHPVPGSEPNHFNATGIFAVPWDMRFSTSVTLTSGGATPITDFSQGDSLAGRLATGVKRGAKYPQNGYRDVDFRLTKDFNAVRGTTVGVIAEVFNAFNYTNYGCLNDFLGAPPPNDPSNSKNLASLGIPNCVVSLGRREQVGLRLTF